MKKYFILLFIVLHCAFTAMAETPIECEWSPSRNLKIVRIVYDTGKCPDIWKSCVGCTSIVSVNNAWVLYDRGSVLVPEYIMFKTEGDEKPSTVNALRIAYNYFDRNRSAPMYRSKYFDVSVRRLKQW